jgi:hypothetical protein
MSLSPCPHSDSTLLHIQTYLGIGFYLKHSVLMNV